MSQKSTLGKHLGLDKQIAEAQKQYSELLAKMKAIGIKINDLVNKRYK